jgi:hypothetical protein
MTAAIAVPARYFARCTKLEGAGAEQREKYDSTRWIYMACAALYYETYSARYIGVVRPVDEAIFSGSDWSTELAMIRDGTSNTCMIGGSRLEKTNTAYGGMVGTGTVDPDAWPGLPPHERRVPGHPAERTGAAHAGFRRQQTAAARVCLELRGHRPKAALVPIGTGCGGTEAAPVTFGPKATSENASVCRMNGTSLGARREQAWTCEHRTSWLLGADPQGLIQPAYVSRVIH